jgi:hypothetical protein
MKQPSSFAELKYYGGKEVLAGMVLSVRKGSVLGLLLTWWGYRRWLVADFN